MALPVAAAIGFSIIGSRTSGPLADLSFAFAVVIALGLLYVGFYGRFLAWAWVDKARPIDEAIRSVFPRLRRWSWPLALVVTLGLGLSVVVLRAWWHAPPEQTAHIDFGDQQWLRDLMNRSDKPH
ncbi:hypothetical protein [Dongia sp.]|uniref:hypothetical protein n=1 Tax=Dongia sp. TaxID=1977262 RepID=UPI00375307CA